MAEPVTFEYDYEECYNYDSCDLNTYGARGFELVNVVYRIGECKPYVFYFKRRISTAVYIGPL